MSEEKSERRRSWFRRLKRRRSSASGVWFGEGRHGVTVNFPLGSGEGIDPTTDAGGLPRAERK